MNIKEYMDSLDENSTDLIRMKKLLALPGLVKEMRDMQTNYFRTRNYLVLERSKKLETNVDEQVKWIIDRSPTTDGQKSLF